MSNRFELVPFQGTNGTAEPIKKKHPAPTRPCQNPKCRLPIHPRYTLCPHCYKRQENKPKTAHKVKAAPVASKPTKSKRKVAVAVPLVAAAIKTARLVRERWDKVQSHGGLTKTESHMTDLLEENDWDDVINGLATAFWLLGTPENDEVAVKLREITRSFR